MDLYGDGIKKGRQNFREEEVFVIGSYVTGAREFFCRATVISLSSLPGGVVM